jgi:TatD DNase family protein
MFLGEYRGSIKHPSDLDMVLARAYTHNVHHLVITAGSLQESQQAIEYVKWYSLGPLNVYCTVGVHPTRAYELQALGYFDELLRVARQASEQGVLVAVGECGLDFEQERVKFCAKDVQLEQFERHFEISESMNLPMFLHNREATKEMVETLKRNRHRFTKAVLHSFTGTMEELDMILKELDEGIYIGVNGCSLKTEENLDVVRKIPMNRLVIETDAPWCEIRPTHAGFKYVQTQWNASKKPEKHVPGIEQTVKNRNEPCHLIQVLEVIAAVKELDIEQAAVQIFENTTVLFPVLAAAGNAKQSS